MKRGGGWGSEQIHISMRGSRNFRQGPNLPKNFDKPPPPPKKVGRGFSIYSALVWSISILCHCNSFTDNNCL